MICAKEHNTLHYFRAKQLKSIASLRPKQYKNCNLCCCTYKGVPQPPNPRHLTIHKICKFCIIPDKIIAILSSSLRMSRTLVTPSSPYKKMKRIKLKVHFVLMQAYPPPPTQLRVLVVGE